MIEKSHTLEHIEVASELESLLLESRLIKKFRPFYNLISKDDKSPYYIHITRETFPRPVINHEPKNSISGPFLNRYIPTRILNHFRHITPYCVSQRTLKRPCLYSHLGLCHPCPANISTPDQKIQYKNNISRLKSLLRGHFSAVKKNLTLQMKYSSKNQNYELAAVYRNQLHSLELLTAFPIPPDEYLANPNLTQDLRQMSLDSLSQLLNIPTLHRIEMYDNSHLSGDSATAAMTVAQNGGLSPNLYRHFTIKKSVTNSDVDMMAEVLSRRLKNTDWPKPDLIVLDGGKPQLSAVAHLLPSGMCLISLTKRDETLIVPHGDTYTEINLPKSHPGLQLLQRLRDEAHRFSRRLHHKHRSQNLLK